MELSIKCCEVLPSIRQNFNWFIYRESDGTRVYCLPHLKGNKGHVRVNYCPSCGNEIRSIEMREKDFHP